MKKVVLMGRRLEALQETLSRLKGGSDQASLRPADVCKESDARKTVEETLRAFGSLEILVNISKSPNASMDGRIVNAIELARARHSKRQT